MKKFHLFLLTAVMACSAMLCGCASSSDFHREYLANKYETENYYISPDPADLYLKRVILVPFYNDTEFEGVDEQVTETFRVELEKMHRFEIIPAGKYAKVLKEQNFFTDGEYDQTKLYMVARALNANGLIFGAVKQYKPYKPLMLGIKATLIRADTGKVVWATDDTFDCARKNVATKAIVYYNRKIEPMDTITNKLIVSSMRYFSAFVCHELVSSLKFPKK